MPTDYIPTLSEYLDSSKLAVIQLFKCRIFYLNLIKKHVVPSLVYSGDEIQNIDNLRNAWFKENAGNIARYKKLKKHYYDYIISNNIICGSILQSAYITIKLYSSVADIPENLADQFTSKSIAKFCVGRLILSNIPIGLIIYAGRNQHHHIEVEKLCSINEKIFEILSSRNGLYSTPMPDFDMEQRFHLSYAANIVGLLGWNSHLDYFRDLREMLQKDIAA